MESTAFITRRDWNFVGVYAGLTEPDILVSVVPLLIHVEGDNLFGLTYQNPVKVSMATTLPPVPGVYVGGPIVWDIPPDLYILFCECAKYEKKSKEIMKSFLIFL
jgi:hypothetical protein